MRLLATMLVVSVAAAAAGAAHASLFFLFNPTRVAPGDTVTVRTGGTPVSFSLGDRLRPFQTPMTVYLVPEAVAASVRSRADPRLISVGTLVPDKNGHGVLTFRVPALHPGTYATAAWCPGCAENSFSRRFFTLPDNPQILPRYRMLIFLRVESRSSSFLWWWIVAAVALLAATSAAFFVHDRAHPSAQRPHPTDAQGALPNAGPGDS